MTNTMQNFLESKETITTTYAYHCFLPEQEKAVLSKFYMDDGGNYCYTEECYDRSGKLFINEAVDSANEELQELELELESGKEDRKVFLKTVIAILEQCADAGIDEILF